MKAKKLIAAGIAASMSLLTLAGCGTAGDRNHPRRQGGFPRRAVQGPCPTGQAAGASGGHDA